jgi:protein O-GlcNAc transferase
LNKPDIHSAVKLHKSGQWLAAEEMYRALLSQNPENFDASHLLGILFLQNGKIDEAISQITAALRIRPDSAEAFSNLGNAYSDLGAFEKALEQYETAIKLKPDFADAYVNRGNALRSLKRGHESIKSFDAALSIHPERADAFLGRGTTLRQLKRHDEALKDFDRAIALSPLNATAYNNRANTLKELKRFNEALVSFDKALSCNPDFSDAWVNRGNLLKDMRCLPEARDSYARALLLKRASNLAKGQHLHAKMLLSDWQDYTRLCEDLRRHVNHDENVTTPFTLLALPSSASEQLKCAKNYARHIHPRAGALWQGEIYAHEKIRVAYLSADYHEHATSYLMAGLFEEHDKNKFELTAISFGKPDASPMRKRLEKAFDHFIDVTRHSDHEVAQLIRDRHIDIAIDLKGFTQDARTDIFAWRPAPVQVNYIGYPGTMGAPYIDYIIADPVLIPRDIADDFSEKIAYLPDTYQVNDSRRATAAAAPSRTELGLPEKAFVFCSFNNNYKITPDVFDVWMNLLRKTENSVLWLLEANAGVAGNMHAEAEKRGISRNRIIFAPKMMLEHHLARHVHADLFLDTIPCNAHTTASDALWAGLPVLTCMGQTFASRVAGSLLLAAGMPELITHSLGDYEILALQLAQDRQRLAAIREKLSKNIRSSALYDTARYARHLESAYLEMIRKQRAGQPPATFHVPRI